MAKRHSRESPATPPKSMRVKSGGHEIRPVKCGRKASAPKNEDSFGFILWQILGGENTYMAEAAERLKVKASYLSSIIHGREWPSQQAIIKNRWREALAQYYPDGWRQYRPKFEKRARALIPKRGFAHKPKDKNGLGFTLWQILGGENANRAEAARRLKVNADYLGKIIHGQARISQQAIIKNRWREALALYYPEGWQQYRLKFEKYVGKLNSRSGAKSREPEDKNGIGFALWRILGGENANLAEAAGRLKVSADSLSQIIHGRRQISRPAIINEKQWREALAQYYPDGWQRYRPKFEKGVSMLSVKSGFLSREPEEKDGIGFVLWQILGGKNANMAEAARRLNVHKTVLSQIIHGKRRVSQEAITEKEWPKTLAQYYPEAWQQHHANFNQRASALPIILKPGHQPREPANKDGFSSVLWLILGGKYADIAEAAGRLKVRTTHLSNIIHGKKRISQKAIIEKKWPETLAQYYPDGWKQHGADFDQRISALIPKTGGFRCREPESKISKDWRTEAGKLVHAILAGRGDEIADILPYVEVPALKKAEIWGKIVEGDQTVELRLWKAALEEVCNLYNLKNAKRPDRQYVMVRKLMRKFRNLP